jgi:DUF4097 and DUF4098 domain-containing protein YvlB
MKKALLVLLLASLCPALAPGNDSFKLEKKDSVEKVFTFSFPEKAKTVKVDNVFGSITVTGAHSAEVRLEARKRLRADSEADMEKAERDVRLNMSEKDNVLDIYVDGPFRRSNGSSACSDPGYEVAYDFILRVPGNASLVLKTVTDGDIRVENVRGELTVRHVNGRIELRSIAGSVSCKTVNGGIRADFVEGPSSACSFATVNGDLDVSFSPRLAADFRLSSLNGDVYTDFADVRYMPEKTSATGSREKGRFVYRSRRSQVVRVGAGGSEITMETINGDITIADRDKKGE